MLICNCNFVCTKMADETKASSQKTIEESCPIDGVDLLTSKEESWRCKALVSFVLLVNFAAFAVFAGLYAANLYSQTVTTLSNSQVKESLEFPSVTICNLNLAKRSILEFKYPAVASLNGLCVNGSDEGGEINTLTVQELLDNAADTPEVLYCRYGQHACLNDDGTLNGEYLSAIHTTLGRCLVFNPIDAFIPHVEERGWRNGLEIHLRVNQLEYSSLEWSYHGVGVKITVHPKSEPADPLNHGLLVPQGMTAFISMLRRDVKDTSTKRTCLDEDSHSPNTEFYLSNYPYSRSRCLRDCILSDVTDTCGCWGIGVYVSDENVQEFGLQSCSVRQALCCVRNTYFYPKECNCPLSCDFQAYDTTASYSDNQYPGEADLARINIYFEDLYVTEQNTRDATTIVDFVPSVGGLFGLFLGPSLISAVLAFIWCMRRFFNTCYCYDDAT